MIPQFTAMVADVGRSVGRRFAAVAVLCVLAAAAEGGGLLLLLPLLDLLGVAQEGRGGGGLPALRAVGQSLGLEGALVLYVVLMAGAAGIVWARSVASAALTQDYVALLRVRLHRAVLTMGWPEIARRRQADLTQALLAETDRCGFAVSQLLQLLAAALQLPALLAAALALSPAFTAVALGLAGALALAVRPLARRSYALGAALRDSHRALNAELTDQIAGLRLIKAMGIEPHHTALVARMTRSVREGILGQVRAAATVTAVQRTAAAAVAALAVWTGMRRMGLPLADMLVLLALFARLVPAALRMQEHWRIILQQLPVHAHLMAEAAAWSAAAEAAAWSAAAEAAAWSAAAEAAAGSTAAEAAAGPAPVLAREIVLRGVGYAHPAGEGRRAALHGIDARLPAFATTALVGPSGAGKSTLADLVMGLAAPSHGTILVDGTPLDGPARVAWRRRIGYVPQDPFLFHKTIRENLLLADPQAPEAALHEVLELAAAADLVRGLPQGLDTPVGDRGARLSGGERQRIVLARALLRRPTLLVLDEATSALDAGTELLVAEALRRLHGRMTVLVVAHRPSTVRTADHVLLLEEGRLLAAGDWDGTRAAAGAKLRELGL